MALPLQNWRYSGTIGLSTNDDPDNLLDDVADWLNNGSSTYHDGVARTPGSGSAWTAVKEVSGVTVAIRLQPPTDGGATDQRVIFASLAAGAPTPVMVANDAFEVNRFYTGHVRGVPTGDETDYTNWDNGTSPYTGFDFTGYMHTTPLLGSGTITSFSVFEGEEAILVTFHTTGNLVYVGGGGALIDPFSTAGADAEADGRLYSAMTSGGSSGIGPSPHQSSASSSGIFTHSTTNRNPKFVTFDPASSSTLVSAKSYFSNGISANDLRTPSGTTRFTPPISIHQETTFIRGLGFLRSIVMLDEDLHGTVLQQSGTDKIYVISGDTVTVRDAYGLLAED